MNELKMRIRQIQDEISQLGSPEPVMPEMINATNAIRLNEYLTKTDEKKTALNAAYDDYTRQLEQIVSTLLSIQVDLKDIIKAEASIMAEQESQKSEKKTRVKKSTK
ncbi:MAG: hypothetical protein EPO63_07760 [Candidatus Nitrosotenuis sp.]|nr:MAG: hypothetical protein EPO63_07760 [Candidatus Nitrosotenuis sp.]